MLYFTLFSENQKDFRFKHHELLLTLYDNFTIIKHLLEFYFLKNKIDNKYINLEEIDRKNLTSKNFIEI